VLLHFQSAHIAQGVDNAADQQGEEGAGDQGIMFGYACNETPELMPAPIYYSHKILELLAAARHKGEGEAAKLGPDAKSQVTVRYKDGKPAEVTQIVLSTQHDRRSWNSARRSARSSSPIFASAFRRWLHLRRLQLVHQPDRQVRHRRPDGDAGLTGRKIIVDTYGGAAPHGGGAFSGKDTTKVDRSAAYAARYLAKNVVAAKIAERCNIQLSYAIGVAQPLSSMSITYGTGKVDDAAIEIALREVMDLSPSGIRKHLDLNKPIYAKTAAYGHFGRKPGRDGSFAWEKTNLVKPLKEALGVK
jgi:S-adenosylmethionine synthetase